MSNFHAKSKGLRLFVLYFQAAALTRPDLWRPPLHLKFSDHKLSSFCGYGPPFSFYEALKFSPKFYILTQPLILFIDVKLLYIPSY